MTDCSYLVIPRCAADRAKETKHVCLVFRVLDKGMSRPLHVSVTADYIFLISYERRLWLKQEDEQQISVDRAIPWFWPAPPTRLMTDGRWQ
jgi:hypothetical protein